MDFKHLSGSAFAALTAIFFCFASALFTACGDDEAEPKPGTEQPQQGTTPDQEGKVGAVTLTLDNQTATTENPAVVSSSTPTTVNMSLASTYTEPNGTTFQAQPKASVHLAVEADTIRGTNVADVVAISRIKDTNNQQTQGEIVTTQVEQHYAIGKQTVRFNISYERIDHHNTAGKVVTLPYMRLSSATPGETSTIEKQATAKAARPRLTAVRLRPVAKPATRGSITSEQVYDVSVTFTIEATPTNAAEPMEARTLAFDVHYVAVVEKTTEYPDPQTTFSYKTKPLSGTTCTQSPFALTGGASSMTIACEQQSAYTWFDTQRMEQQAVNYAPTAQITVSITKDTVHVDNDEILKQTSSAEPVVRSEGDNPTVYSGSQTYEIGGGQTISINWGYDAYGSIEIEGSQIAIPYLELSQPELVDVTVTERPDVLIPDETATAFEVSALFRQMLTPRNVSESEPKTIEYIVRYMAVKEVRLTKVVYRKSWEWNTPHDNIILAWAPIVYRDRIYSDGKTFTDTFSGSFLFVTLALATAGHTNSVTGEFSWDGGKITYHSQSQAYMDSIFIKTRSIGVTRLSDVIEPEEEESEGVYLSISPGEWAKYGQSKLYDSGVNVPSTDGVEFVGNNGTSERASGWYAWEVVYYRRIARNYKNSMPPLTNYLVDMEVLIGNPDQFLVMDGKMINYLEYRGEPQTTIHTEDITMPNGAPARVYKLEGRQHFLDKNFYVAAIDTVYQFAPSAGVKESAPTHAHHNHQTASSGKQEARQTVPSPDEYTPTPLRKRPYIEYGGAPRGMEVPPMHVASHLITQ